MAPGAGVVTEFAGTLRERINIETREATRDALAGASGGYAFAGQAWAAVMPIVPGDLVQGNALSAANRWHVTMRKRESVDLRARLVWRGRLLAVRSIVTDPREPAQMVLTCEEMR